MARRNGLAIRGRLAAGEDGGGSSGKPVAPASEHFVTVDDEKVNPFGLQTSYDAEINFNVFATLGAAVADPLMSLVDTYFVAYLGTISLASVGANTAVFNAVFHFGTFACCHSVTNHVAHALAKTDKARSGRDLLAALTLTVLLGCIFAYVMCTRSLEVLQAIGVSPELYREGAVYMFWRGLAVPATLFILSASGVFRAVLDMRTPLRVVITAGLLNLILDPLFMFGFGWGVQGAAIATATAQYVGAFMLARLLWKNRSLIGIEQALQQAQAARAFAPVRYGEIFQLVKTMAQLGLRSMNIILVWGCAGAFVARLGVAATAGHQIVLQAVMLLLNFSFAYLTVGQAMMASREQPYYRYRNLAMRIIAACTVVTASLSGVLWLSWRGLLLSLTSDPLVLRATLPCVLPVAALVFFANNNAFEGLCIGAGDIKYVTLVYGPATAIFALGLYSAYYFSTGLFGVWQALCAYYFSLSVMLFSRLYFKRFRGPLHKDTA